jgi:hypothetical protein
MTDLTMIHSYNGVGNGYGNICVSYFLADAVNVALSWSHAGAVAMNGGASCIALMPYVGGYPQVYVV